MTIKTSSYRQSHLTALLDPVEASAYLNAALEDSPEAFLKASKNVAQARQMSKVAKDAGIQRETLYRSFSEQGNPTLETLSSVLAALGMKISISPNDFASAAYEARPPQNASRRSLTPLRLSRTISFCATFGTRRKRSLTSASMAYRSPTASPPWKTLAGTSQSTTASITARFGL